MLKQIRFFVIALSFTTFSSSCDKDPVQVAPVVIPVISNSTSVFLFIDEESIDNGNQPNNFSETDVNDQLANIGYRQTLKYFSENVGKTIDLYTGQVGDEGWFAPSAIPNTWINAGPTGNGTVNYLSPGPGLGEANNESLLDDVLNIIPLRATGLSMLKGKTIYAVVFDNDISINYSPIRANLQGANLGIVAFDVLDVIQRTDGSSSDLPRVKIHIRNVNDVQALPITLFSNVPIPSSSSEPMDIAPPTTIPAALFIPAP